MNKRQLWKKIKQRGPILWDNTDGIMRHAGPLYAMSENGDITEEIVDYMPQTYNFKGVPAYYSFLLWFRVGAKIIRMNLCITTLMRMRELARVGQASICITL